MVFAVLLPFFAACYVFAAAFLKKRTFAWEIGTAAAGLAFLNIVSMAFKNFFSRTGLQRFSAAVSDVERRRL